MKKHVLNADFNWLAKLCLPFLAALFIPAILFAENPEQQPIDFSHKTHAEVNKIACEYCHIGARRSSSSIVPPMRTCVGCHYNTMTDTPIVAGTTPEQKKEINRVIEYWKSQTPIPWKKIHDLPDFVYFSHKKHVQAGFDCTQCHGEVSETKVPVRDEKSIYFNITPLTMGWCVQCHRTEHPTVDGKVIPTYGIDLEELPKSHKGIRTTRGASLEHTQVSNPTPDGIKTGPTDCLVCHK